MELFKLCYALMWTCIGCCIQMGFCGLEDELDDLLLSRLSNHVVLGVKLDIVDIFIVFALKWNFVDY